MNIDQSVVVLLITMMIRWLIEELFGEILKDKIKCYWQSKEQQVL